MATKKKRVNNKSTGRKSGAGTTHAKHNAKPHIKKRRAAQNAARRAAMKKGLVKKGDNKDVHHVGAKKSSNLRKVKTKVISRSKNRAMKPKGFRGNTGRRKKR